jgi:hypothetical protein
MNLRGFLPTKKVKRWTYHKLRKRPIGLVKLLKGFIPGKLSLEKARWSPLEVAS